MEVAKAPGVTLADLTHSNSGTLANQKGLLVYGTAGPPPGLLITSAPWGLEALGTGSRCPWGCHVLPPGRRVCLTKDGQAGNLSPCQDSAYTL